MTKEQNIYHRNKIGWFIEMPGYDEGPLDSREEAVNFANLVKRVAMARSTEVACTDKECF